MKIQLRIVTYNEARNTTEYTLLGYVEVDKVEDLETGIEEFLTARKIIDRREAQIYL